MKIMTNNYAVFILSHGRPDSVKTYGTLRKQGYTGSIYIVVDDQDDALANYLEKFGDEVVTFSKVEIGKTFDQGDNTNSYRGVIYARNAVFGIAKSLNYKYFIVLDDDYIDFVYKFDSKYQYNDRPIKNLDKIFEAFFDFYIKTPALTIAMAQGGDFIGGRSGSYAKELKPKRKCMNTFFCSTDRPFQFVGRINEDVNTPIVLGSRGGLFLTIPNTSINQTTTQKTAGGMTELYLDGGTYLKSFYSVMYSPSCVKVSMMGSKHRRIHHRVSWNNAVPAILSCIEQNSEKTA